MANSTGINRLTFQPLSDWEHVKQSIQVIFTTRIGSRVMRRTFGSFIPQVLGRNLVDRTLMRFFTAIVVAIELWEPRFRVTQIRLPEGQNTPELMREGKIGIMMIGQYRPNALHGDLTPDLTPRTLII